MRDRVECVERQPLAMEEKPGERAVTHTPVYFQTAGVGSAEGDLNRCPDEPAGREGGDSARAKAGWITCRPARIACRAALKLEEVISRGMMPATPARRSRESVPRAGLPPIQITHTLAADGASKLNAATDVGREVEESRAIKSTSHFLSSATILSSARCTNFSILPRSAAVLAEIATVIGALISARAPLLSKSICNAVCICLDWMFQRRGRSANFTFTDASCPPRAYPNSTESPRFAALSAR